MPVLTGDLKVNKHVVDLVVRGAPFCVPMHGQDSVRTKTLPQCQTRKSDHLQQKPFWV